jgi:hypothetical protein
MWKEAVTVYYVSTKASTHVQTPRLTQRLLSRRCGKIWNTVYSYVWSTLYVHKKGVQLKSKLQHAYRPTVPFRQLGLISLSQPDGKLQRGFNHVITALSYFLEHSVPLKCAKTTKASTCVHCTGSCQGCE